MKARRRLKCRLWVEELESRQVLSTTGLPTAVLHSIQTTAVTSTNWSGYAVQTNLSNPQASAFSAVAGSWTVPAVTGTGTSYSSYWVGLDGYSSNSVEQIGTDSDITNGKATYYAWYEMYPKGSVNITALAILPGDTITASVTYTAPNKYALTLSATNNAVSPPQTSTYTTTQTAAKMQRSSAEWVVEAPSSNFGVLPLSNFGTASFSSATATLTGSTTPTSLDNPSATWQVASINMTNRQGQTIANTSSIDAAAGTIFSVTYATPPAVPPPPPQQPHGHWWTWWSTNSGQDDPSTMAVAIQMAIMQSTQNPNGVPVATISTFSVPVAAVGATGPAVAAPTGPLAQPASFYLYSGSVGADGADMRLDMPDGNVIPVNPPPMERMENSYGQGNRILPLSPFLGDSLVNHQALAVDWNAPTTSLFGEEETDHDCIRLTGSALTPLAAVAGVFLFAPELRERRRQQFRDYFVF